MTTSFPRPRPAPAVSDLLGDMLGEVAVGVYTDATSFLTTLAIDAAFYVLGPVGVALYVPGVMIRALVRRVRAWEAEPLHHGSGEWVGDT